jgi:RHS repeat-associated protein
MVTDASANPVARHDYVPFGMEIPTGYAGRTGVSGASDGLSPKFTGQDRDTDTGLDFFQARYMGSGQGRFTSADPAGNFVADPGNPQSWNLYSYVWNNPLALVDPSGLDPCDSFDSSGCDVSGLDINLGWNGPDPAYQPPPPLVPPPPTPIPNPTTGPWGNPGGSCFANACQAQPSGPNLPVSGINIAALVNYLNCNALPGFGQGQCSKYVYQGLSAASANFHGKLNPAGGKFGPLLQRIGCPVLSPPPPIGYDPKPGDVMVIQPTSKNPSGHVQVWAGDIWISDHIQNGSSKPWPGPVYKKEMPPYAVYRCN